MINYKDYFKKSYEDYIETILIAIDNCEEELSEFNNQKTFDKKCAWLANSVFGITTYDDELDVEFGKDIYNVMKVILTRKTFSFIEDKNNYKKFIIICNLLESHNLIEWGTSIRGCWFDFYNKNDLNLTQDSLEYLLDEFMLNKN